MIKQAFLTGVAAICWTAAVWAQADSTQMVTLSRQQYEDILRRLNALEEQEPTKALPADSVHEQGNPPVAKSRSRLQLGGYGEISMHRYFYSDNFMRYSHPADFRNKPSRGQFDLPHVVFFVSYDFGKGWKISSEIEFEHGGSGGAFELESEEFGEYEQEVEKGGEVVLEQFWIEKSFSPAANLRVGHIIVPIGLTNQFHLPTEFFSVLRPEEESTILPLTWHETGISFWGRTKYWRYEAQFLAGLDAERFSKSNWIKGGALSPYEFKLASAYAVAARVDNYSVKGLRMALSAYYGHSGVNSLKADRYIERKILGQVIIGSFDAAYSGHGVIADICFVYGHLTDAAAISQINRSMAKNSPSPRTNVASDAMAMSLNVGYDIFSFFRATRQREMKFYLFAHAGHVNSMLATEGGIPVEPRFARYLFGGGMNFYPVKNIVIKAEFMSRLFLGTPYNPEHTFSVGAAYAGLFSMNQR